MEQKYKVVEYHLIPANVEKGEKPFSMTEYHLVAEHLTWKKAKELCKSNKTYSLVFERLVGSLEKGK
jgi:hypothetical protein